MLKPEDVNCFWFCNYIPAQMTQSQNRAENDSKSVEHDGFGMIFPFAERLEEQTWGTT